LTPGPASSFEKGISRIVARWVDEYFVNAWSISRIFLAAQLAADHRIEDSKIIVRNEPFSCLRVFRSLMMQRNQRGVMANSGSRLLQSTTLRCASFAQSRFAIEFHWLKLQPGDPRGARISTRLSMRDLAFFQE